jgi:hypothetical protein
MAVLLGGFPVLAQSQSAPAQRFCDAQAAKCFSGYDAKFIGPTRMYQHGVLGDDVEWSGLLLTSPQSQKQFLIGITEEVFEDIQPRLADMDGDGVPEVIVVQTHPSKGAQLAIYSQSGVRVATPYIGTRYRWLAPIGAADFNGDGHMDVAYVDRPHLAKTLRVWTYRDGALTEIAAIGGVTNHVIGESFITSAIRNCDGRPEMILTDGDRKNIVSVFFENGALAYKSLGPYKGTVSVTNPPACN